MSKQSCESDGGLGSDLEENEDERLHRNRQRNREHARKTRVRKKEQLQALKAKVNELEEECRELKQGIQECSVASILLGLSSGTAGGAGAQVDGNENTSNSGLSPSNFGACLAGGKRKRFLSLDGGDPTPPPMKLNIKGHITVVGGPGNECKARMNWKTGSYIDNEGNRQQLTKSELEELRRERNRMHAKMTRDRKKCFIASLKRVISKLEEENRQLRETLEKSRADRNIQSSELKKKTGNVHQSVLPTNVKQSNSSSTFNNTTQSMFSSNIYTVG